MTEKKVFRDELRSTATSIELHTNEIAGPYQDLLLNEGHQRAYVYRGEPLYPQIVQKTG